ncbi:MAG TPA: tetratricopeptide repeat protein [Patescibacteria group bacterium]|nr:tetratricopeptide repeat protein [Patescibacteria group bacterium]
MKRFMAAILAALLVWPACAGTRRGSSERSIEKVVTHKVREGETWQSMARDFYRDGTRAGELASFNGTREERPPAGGDGVRVPLSRTDLELLEKRLDAASAYNLGIELASAGNYGEAVERFQRALSIDPNMSEASFNLAVTYQKLGLHVKAVSLLRELVERDPGRADYHFALGNSHFHTGDFVRAKDAFMRTLEIDRTHRRALYSLAVVHEKRAERDEALRCYREYLEIDPEGAWADEARARRDAIIRSSDPER